MSPASATWSTARAATTGARRASVATATTCPLRDISDAKQHIGSMSPRVPHAKMSTRRGAAAGALAAGAWQKRVNTSKARAGHGRGRRARQVVAEQGGVGCRARSTEESSRTQIAKWYPFGARFMNGQKTESRSRCAARDASQELD